MSGIYIHIPFCKKACHYCNFHFSTSLRLKDDMISAICFEIEKRKDYLHDTHLQSIYFGGGTPSLLNEGDLHKIFGKLSQHFTWDQKSEITLESNPDDLDVNKLAMLQRLGINRLSIGVQSFFDEDLVWMNRAHNADEAQHCIKAAQDVGFSNITIDLIYGCPSTTNEMWEQNINHALSMQIPHISSYCLTVEEKTALHHQVKTGKISQPDAEMASEQFSTLMDRLQSAGFDHYEISNFGKPGHHAIHNTNYWKGAHYLGLGPAAHSFDGSSRSWNIANNKKYIDACQNGTEFMESETLSDATRYNEYIMTGLRTMWGIDYRTIKEFGDKYYDYFCEMIAKAIQDDLVFQAGDNITLTQAGKFFADRIAMTLFWVED